MSSEKKVLIIEHKIGNEEHLRMLGVPCGYCQGNGFFTPTQIARDEYKDHPCPVCGGAGQLIANIAIVWTPDSIPHLKNIYKKG